MINVILTLCLFIMSNMVYVFYDVINFPFTGHFGACGPLLPRVQTSIPAIHHCLCIVLQNDVKISNVSYDVIIMLIAPILLRLSITLGMVGAVQNEELSSA